MNSASKDGPGLKPRVLALVASVVVIGLAIWAWRLWNTAPEPEAVNPSPAQGVVAPPVAGEPLPPPVAPKVSLVTVSLGIPVKLARHARIAVPSPPYGPAFERLFAAAKNGDTQSQYQLGLLLYECRDVPADEVGLTADIDVTYQTRRRGGWDVDNPAQEEQTLRRRYADCAGVPAEQRGQYREWMRQAADAGMIEAQLDLPLHLPPGEYCQYMEQCTSEQREKQEALQAEAVNYYQQARDAGSINALWTLAAWQVEGDVMSQNLVEAYADFLALDQVYTAAGEQSRFKGMLADIKTKLRPVDLEQAQARTKELLSAPNCCVMTP